MKHQIGEIYYRQGEQYIKTKDGTFTYYRYLVEQYLGFMLPKGYTVHHLNEDHHDNRIENLCIIPTILHVWIHRCSGTKDLLESNINKIKNNPKLLFVDNIKQDNSKGDTNE